MSLLQTLSFFVRSTDYTDDEANEIEARRKLESQGVDWLVDFSASDQRAFLDAAAETWKEAANDAGGDALNNRARILKLLVDSPSQGVSLLVLP